jgi:hypothetical protein
VIKPEQIPDEVVDAMLESIGSFFCRAEARAACAAMLAAWPGRFNGNAWPDLAPTIVLPLTQENNNGSD